MKRQPLTGADFPSSAVDARANERMLGSSSGRVSVVLYGDYGSENSQSIYQDCRSALYLLPEGWKFIWRHFPLGGLHPEAQRAAQAAEAAGAQGRFWEMHDCLLRSTGTLGRRHLLDYAEEIGLDLQRFRRDLDGNIFEDKVREDFRLGIQDGVFRAPALLLQGFRLSSVETRLPPI